MDSAGVMPKTTTPDSTDSSRMSKVRSSGGAGKSVSAALALIFLVGLLLDEELFDRSDFRAPIRLRRMHLRLSHRVLNRKPVALTTTSQRADRAGEMRKGESLFDQEKPPAYQVVDARRPLMAFSIPAAFSRWDASTSSAAFTAVWRVPADLTTGNDDARAHASSHSSHRHVAGFIVLQLGDSDTRCSRS
jgi:hypothetical protein